LRMIREELGVNTTGGASNVTFGLPNRGLLNGHFLSMAIAHGLTSAITNPCESDIRQAIYAADALAGHDENCAAWILANRDTTGINNGKPVRRSRKAAIG